MIWGDFKSLVRAKVRIESSSYLKLDNIPPFGSEDDRELWRLFQIFCRISRMFWCSFLHLSVQQGDQEVSLLDLSRCPRRIFRPASVWIAGLELDAYEFEALALKYSQVTNQGFFSGAATATLNVAPLGGVAGYTVFTDSTKSMPVNKYTGATFRGVSGGCLGSVALVASNTATTFTLPLIGANVGDQYTLEYQVQSKPLGWSESRQGVLYFNAQCDASVTAAQNAVSGFADHVDLATNNDLLQIDLDSEEAAAECVATWLGRPVASDSMALARLGEYSKYSQEFVMRSRAQGEREARFTPKITSAQMRHRPWRAG